MLFVFFAYITFIHFISFWRLHWNHLQELHLLQSAKSSFCSILNSVCFHVWTVFWQCSYKLITFHWHPPTSSPSLQCRHVTGHYLHNHWHPLCVFSPARSASRQPISLDDLPEKYLMGQWPREPYHPRPSSMSDKATQVRRFILQNIKVMLFWTAIAIILTIWCVRDVCMKLVPLEISCHRRATMSVIHHHIWTRKSRKFGLLSNQIV